MTDTVPHTIAHTTLERLTVRLLHVEAVQPLYRREYPDNALRLTEATVFISADAWPPDADLTDAAIIYGMQVTDLERDRITLGAMAPGASGSKPPEAAGSLTDRIAVALSAAGFQDSRTAASLRHDSGGAFYISEGVGATIGTAWADATGEERIALMLRFAEALREAKIPFIDRTGFGGDLYVPEYGGHHA